MLNIYTLIKLNYIWFNAKWILQSSDGAVGVIVIINDSVLCQMMHNKTLNSKVAFGYIKASTNMSINVNKCNPCLC